LARQKGTFYNIFKTKPDLMALFDACKTLEEDSKSLFSGHGAAESTDDSNNDGDTAEEDSCASGGPSILPLDPKMKDVRYLGPKPDDAPQYTLVLDLDETLIHYHDNSAKRTDTDHTTTTSEKKHKSLLNESAAADSDDEEEEDVEFSIRPGLSSFLNNLSKHYELVLYTAATREYADYFLRMIDPRGLFSDGNILTREHCKFNGDYAIKDLRLLGRDLRKTIIIDNLEENFIRTTPDNGMHISNFEGCFSDNELPRYQQFLTRLALNEEADVRNVIYDFRDKWETYE